MSVALSPTPLSATTLGCRHCGAALVVGESERTVRCPYCASPQIVVREPTANRPAPTFVIPFTFREELARDLVSGWLGRLGFFRDPKWKRAAISDMRGVYVPVYVYSAETPSNYTASIGETYWETETYEDTDSSGKRVTKTRRVSRTEWRDLAGDHSAYVMDVLVTGSRGIANQELEAVEPFDLRQMRRYDDAFIAGWITEEPTLSPSECMANARSEALAKVGAALSRFMPGDRQSDLRHRTRLDRETVDAMLVPIWILAVRATPEMPLLRLLINGQSGKVVGHAPLSKARVGLAVLLLVAVIALVVLLSRLR